MMRIVVIDNESGVRKSGRTRGSELESTKYVLLKNYEAMAVGQMLTRNLSIVAGCSIMAEDTN